MTNPKTSMEDVKKNTKSVDKSTKDVKSTESRCKLCNKTHDSKPINKKEFVKVANRVNDVESRFEKKLWSMLFNFHVWSVEKVIDGFHLHLQEGEINKGRDWEEYQKFLAFIKAELKTNDKKAYLKGFVDGGHSSGTQAEEICNDRLRENDKQWRARLTEFNSIRIWLLPHPKAKETKPYVSSEALDNLLKEKE